MENRKVIPISKEGRSLNVILDNIEETLEKNRENVKMVFCAILIEDEDGYEQWYPNCAGEAETIHYMLSKYKNHLLMAGSLDE